MSKELKTLNSKELTLDSRDVAEMMDILHSDVLKKLDGTYHKDGRVKQVGIIPTLTKGNFPLSKYFIESTYKDKSGKENKCYLLTKMGCEFLANKFNGEKGILFTAKYVERFNEMEEKQNQFKLPHTYKEALLQLVEQVEENEKLNTVIEDMTPKAIIGDTFTSTANAYDMGVFSKVLSINGLGRNNMFQWLRDKKILMKGNTPFQRYNKYFKVVMVTNSFGFANPKTLINPKGVEFIVKKLIEDEYIITKSIDEILKELNSKEDYAIIL